MMSNSNYIISLQRLKPVHTAYCGLHNFAENWSWAQDVNGRDRDETETLTIFLETRPRRDVGMSRDRLETETRPRPQPWYIHCEAKKLHHFIFATTLSNLSVSF